MDELPAILKLWEEVEEHGGCAVLATVVRVRGSAYRRPGARLLFTADGRRAGSVSGGCLEGDLIKKGWWLTENGRRVVTYGTGSNEDGTFEFGLGCNGVIDVMVERIEPSAAKGVRRLMAECRSRRQAGLVATVVEASPGTNVHATSRLLLFPDGTCETDIDSSELVSEIRADADSILRLKKSACSRYHAADVFLEFIGAPARLVIFGGGTDAVPLAMFSTSLGWDVVVVDHRSVQAMAGRFCHPGITVLQSTDDLANVPLEPDSMAVVMTHSYERDRVLLRNLLRRPLRYLGVLGPRERTHRLLAELANGASQNGSLHFPVGLDIGSDSPATTALAIAAEMQAVLAGRGGGMLRDRPGPIHTDVRRIRTRQAAGGGK